MDLYLNKKTDDMVLKAQFDQFKIRLVGRSPNQLTADEKAQLDHAWYDWLHGVKPDSKSFIRQWMDNIRSRL